MSTWHIIVLLALAACVTGSLLKASMAIGKLAANIESIRTELYRSNSKLERTGAVNKDDAQPAAQACGQDSSFAEIEAAISNFEKMKRIASGAGQTSVQTL